MFPIRTSVATDDISGTVIGLIAANVAVFLLLVGLPAELAEQFVHQHALVPARYTRPEVAEAIGLEATNPLPFLTNAFMHAGWVHLGVNMWTLWLFGRALEDRLGPLRFMALYLGSGIVASLAHFASDIHSATRALGASGAIAGLLGAYTLLYPRARIDLVTPILFFPLTYALPAVVYTSLWFVYQLANGLPALAGLGAEGGIAWWAHIGGLVAGLALIKIIGSQPVERRARDRHRADAE